MIIYESENSRLTASYDGELVTLLHEVFGDGQWEVGLYLDECEKLVEFINTLK